MNIHVAQSAGFCWGVRQAMDAALEASARWGSKGPVHTLGPLIHNPQALDHLHRRGVTEVVSASEIERGTVVIRAHGVPIQELRDLMARHQRKSLRVINGTCPEVAKVQARIKRYASKGYFTVLLGTRGHAEAVAHESYSSSGCAVVSNLQEASELTFEADQKVLVIAQTTFLTQDFDEIAKYLSSQVRECVVLNTICKDTWKRQREAERLCRQMDYLVVVGGKSSNNTRHLVDLAKGAGKPFQWVESAMDLNLEELHGMQDVGVLAGASTPTWTVDEVLETLKQVGRPSKWRLIIRLSQTLQFPVALLLGLLTWLLHKMLAWPTHWTGAVLPAVFHLGLSAVLPYLDPLGLDAKGQKQSHYLQQNKVLLLGLGGSSSIGAVLLAAGMGYWVLSGTTTLYLLAILYWRLPISSRLRHIPAIKDLSQALIPPLLGVFLPWVQGFQGKPRLLGSAFFILFAIALSIHGLRHLSAFHVDRIVGREVLPVAIGSKATKWMAASLVVVSVGILVMILR